MRTRSLLVVASLAVAAVGVVATAAPVAAAPAGCKAAPTGLVLACDQIDPTIRPRGGIGLIGDSVLLGSNNGVSNPGLNAMLASNGWGPVRMTTLLGMRTYNATTKAASAYHHLDSWKAGGFNPRVVVVNLGANHLGDCTPSTVSRCRNSIVQLLDHIALLYPTATVWWAKIVQYDLLGTSPYSPQTASAAGWNLALDQVAATRSNLVVWDWPAALRTSNILMDPYGIHPRSATEYVKRSRLIEQQIRWFMPARFLGSGANATLPSSAGSPLDVEPLPPVTVYDSQVAPASALAAGSERVVDLSADPDVPAAATALAVTLTVTAPAGPGYLTAYQCGAPRPFVANLNYQKGVSRSAQALVQLSPGRTLCLFSPTATHVSVALQAAFVPAGTGDTFTAVTPFRATSPTTGTPVTPATVTAVTLPASTGAPNLGVAVNLAVSAPTAPGTVSVWACDAPESTVAQLSFRKNETVASSMYAPVAADNTLCARVKMATGATAKLYVDVTGYFRADTAGLRYLPLTPKRLIDTRLATRVGAWYGMHARSQVLSLPAAVTGAPAARAVSGTLTVTGPVANGHLSAYGCNAARPVVSAINFAGGQTVANNLTVGVDPSKGTLCVFAAQSTNTVFDLSGWWVVAA